MQPGYTDRINALLAQGGFRCHRFVAERHISRPELARRAGISNGTLRGIEGADFVPSVKSLAALEAVIPGSYMPSHLAPLIVKGVEISPFIEGQKMATSDTMASKKYYLDRDAVAAIDKAQIAKVRIASEQWSDPNGRIPEDTLNRDLLKTIAPQSAIHIIKVTDPRPEGFEYEIWDTGTGWNSSKDFTGQRISESSEPLLRDCTFEDFMVVREFGWPSLTAISRKFADREERRFLRYLHPIAGRDGTDKILCVCRPQEFQA